VFLSATIIRMLMDYQFLKFGAAGLVAGGVEIAVTGTALGYV
jgi:hypothetical protein